ncbi:MAG: phosphate/phosphite/phosphonate ABC transporter substrate-binding protein [Phycisphaerae bacterium]|nr:phosphate/phosphite/phosphonate ABC transporter substrate-binding protein [Phycisphaerae bacterium]
MNPRLALPLIVSLLWTSGCALSPRLNPLGKNNIRLTTVDTNLLDVMLRFSPLARQLSESLDRPVDVMADWDAKSIRIHLTSQKVTDYYHLVYLNPVDYCEVAREVALDPLAIKRNVRGETGETALIVVHKDSPIQSVADLEGKRIAFGPYGSPYMFYSVLELLRDEKLPISLVKSTFDSRDSLAVVQKLLMGFSDAGVVTRTWWETTKDRSLDLSRLLKDDLRIIAETQPMPELVWAATETLTAEQKAAVVEVLTQKVTEMPSVLGPLGATGFEPIGSDAMEETCRRIDRIRNIPPRPSLLPL